MEIFITCLNFTMFNSVFMKRVYIFDLRLSNEIKDLKSRKLNTLLRVFRFMLLGLISNYLWLAYIYNKLSFYIFDEIFGLLLLPQFISIKFLYFTTLIFLCSRRIIKYFMVSHNLLISGFLIAIHLIIASILDDSSLKFLLATFIFFMLFKWLISRLRLFLALILMIYITQFMIIKVVLSNESLDINEINMIIYNTNFGLIVTILFIVLLYHNHDLSKFSNSKLFERLFIFKLSLDITLYISFIFTIVVYNRQNYLSYFTNLNHIIIFIHLLQHTLTLVFVYLRLKFKFNMSEIDNEFKFEKDDNFTVESSYFEVIIFKNVKFAIDFLSKDVDVPTKKSLKNIKFIIHVILALLTSILMNDLRW